ncbi:hypothetical protein LIER_06858 [Lithospermum erythrorhizon]|uniref:Uncharacterized protein n=1 Tax=Lithospermum erythrorhizon TaxID=34254 RepID=A0AAV3P6C7_LITER
MDPSILTMLNTIHQKVMKRLHKQAAYAKKWKGDIAPHWAKMIEYKEGKTVEYISAFIGHSRYGVSTAHHAWVVDVQRKHCSCGSCLTTQERIYSHFLEPIRGATFWPKLPNLPTGLPPIILVLPGRPKKCRTKDANEKRDKAEKDAAEREKAATKQGWLYFKNSRKGAVMHCKLCGGANHNKKTSPLNDQPTGGASEDGGKNKNKCRSKRKADGTSMSQPTQENPSESTCTPQAQTQPPSTSRKSKKSKRWSLCNRLDFIYFYFCFHELSDDSFEYCYVPYFVGSNLLQS